MKLFKAASTVCLTALMGIALTTIASADEQNKKTTITFSGPVEIPGVHLKGWGVLPAGTYVFKLVDSKSDRHIVQIFNADETVVYATILAIPNYRLKATDKTVITFRERPVGQPEALRAWFYPGANSGEEFVYPKSRAIELAKVVKAPILFTEAAIPVEVAEPIKPADDVVVVQLRTAPVLAIKPTGEQVALLEVVTPPPAFVQSGKLPGTASNLPLLGLLGCLMLGGALLTGVFARRVQ
ncbi:MAG TPA: hypothetical protein VG273_28605 [Bryobacteraceae bacterium]|jgi:hypothetical protein|nr:hypothetical protein [Bryobacteraceae bacterium]